MMGGLQGPSSHSSSPLSKSGVPKNFPFLATFDIPDRYKLTNDPIYHNIHWPRIPHKIPVDILTFEGKQGDDLGTHVTTYHLWCVSNSMVDESIWLWLFPCKLIGNATKWYIKLPCTSINTFGTLAMEFLKHFHLPVHYETGMELLTNLCQDTSTHISHHIHEWRCRRRLIKAPIPYYLLTDWLCKSLLPQIAKDIALGGAVTEYQSIRHAQHLFIVWHIIRHNPQCP